MQTAVLRLRKALGEDLVTTTATGYRIDVDEQRLDLLLFCMLVAVATRLVTTVVGPA